MVKFGPSVINLVLQFSIYSVIYIRSNVQLALKFPIFTIIRVRVI